MDFVDQFPVDLPSSSDPANFDPRADAYYGHLPTFVAQLNALAAILAQAAMPPLAIPYVFSATTTVADPTDGKVRLNNASQTSATALLADLVNGLGQTVTGLLDQIGLSTSTVKGYLKLSAVADPTKWIIWPATGLTSPTGYKNIALQSGQGVGSSASPFADGDLVTLSFVPKGDKGDVGPQVDIAPDFLAYDLGGVVSAGSGRVTRALNTVERNRYGWAFSSYQLTLQAGDYMAWATAGGSGIANNWPVLRNVTDSVDLVTGVTGFAQQVTDLQFWGAGFITFAPFTLVAQKVVRLDHIVTNESGGVTYDTGGQRGGALAIWKRG